MLRTLSKTQFARRLVVAALAATALLHAGISAGHAAPRGLSTPYYTMSVPAGWTQVPGQSVSHQTVTAPDQNADIEVFVAPSRDLGPTALQHYLPSLFGSNGTILTSPAPRFSTTTVQGIHVQVAQALIRWHTGMIGIVEVAAAFYHQRVYVVMGEIVNARAASVSGDATQIDSALGTFAFR